MKAGAVRKLSGAEQRALREQITAADPAAEAWAHESSFLRSLATAKDDFDWIITNTAWTMIGYATFTAWWEARVQPTMSGLWRPTREIALVVLAKVRSDEQALPKAQRRTNKELAALVGLSETSARRTAPRSLPAPNGAGDDLEEASAAGPAANPEGDSPVLGGQDGAATDLTEGGAHGRGLSDPEDSPAAVTESDPIKQLASLPQPGLEPQERIEEEAVEPPVDTPAADPLAPPSPQQPGQDSPPVLGSEGFPGRAETDHHVPASGAGEAPEVASTDPVEPGELEDGEAAVTPSSSVLATAGNPAERLLLAVAGLVHYLDQVDVDVVGPLLFGPDVEQLFSHAEEISAHITRIGKARFAEMLHTP